MNTHDSQTNSNPTVEDLLVRVERQRTRANRWMEKCASISVEKQELESLACDYAEVIQSMQDRIEAIRKVRDSQTRTQKTLLTNMIDQRNGFSRQVDNLQYKLQLKQNAIKIGEREIQKRKTQRRKKLAQKLYSQSYILNGELKPWVRKVIKRQFRIGNHVPIIVVRGNELRELGEPGYYTTPSGKTVVHHPNAYGWRTVYHSSTEWVEVGRGWLARNRKRLADWEASFRVQ